MSVTDGICSRCHKWHEPHDCEVALNKPNEEYGIGPAMRTLGPLRDMLALDRADIKAGRWKALAARKAALFLLRKDRI